MPIINYKSDTTCRFNYRFKSK